MIVQPAAYFQIAIFSLSVILAGSPLLFAAEKQAVSVVTINPQTYASASGQVHNYPEKRIVLYGPRWVLYKFEIDRHGEYLVQLSTAQVSRKPTPSADYRFLFDFLVDEQKVATGVPLAAEKNYVLSDLISLGKLTPGIHTLTVKWTNDAVGEDFDANLGIGSLEIFRS